MPIRTVIFSSSSRDLDSIEEKILDKDLQVIAKSADLTGAADEVGQLRPDLVIISCREDNWSYRASQQIYLLYPQVVTVMVSEDISYDVAKKAIDAGVGGYISPMPDAEEFCDALKQIYYNEQNRISVLLEKSGIQRKAQVITVFGTKGGIGKTTLAVNLAVALTRQKAKVAILDLDLQFGDTQMFLGLDVKETIAELIQEQRVPTIDNIRNYFVLHASGVHLLCAPASPEYAEGINAAQVEPILNILRTYYDYIIVDTSAEFSDVNLLALEAASTILYLTGLDISLLHNSKKNLLIIDSLNQKNKVKLVVSRDFKGDITIGDVEKIMGEKVFARVPADYIEAVKALNQGIPLVSGMTKSPIAKEILRIAGILSNKGEPEKTGRFGVRKK